jgi:hypothetical protein
VEAQTTPVDTSLTAASLANTAKPEQVHLCYRSCDLDFFTQVKECLEVAEVSAIQFDSKKKSLVRCLESLQGLWALLETKQLDQDGCAEFSGLKDDANYIIENHKEMELFRLRMDFFWVAERLAKLCLLAGTDPEQKLKDTPKLAIKHPEAFSSWLTTAQPKLVILPVDLPSALTEKNFFHWGHRYSTQGMRRWRLWDASNLETLKSVSPASLNVGWDEFKQTFSEWLQPEDIAPLQHTLRVDQEDAYDHLQDEFRDTFVALKQIAIESEDAPHILWCEDPGLSTRMALSEEELNPPEVEDET